MADSTVTAFLRHMTRKEKGKDRSRPNWWGWARAVEEEMADQSGGKQSSLTLSR